MLWWNNSPWTPWNKEPSSLTLTCIQMSTDLYQTYYGDRYCWTLMFSTGLSDLYLDSRLQACEKAKTSALIFSQSFLKDLYVNWSIVEACWSDKLIVCHQISIQGREGEILQKVKQKQTNKKTATPKQNKQTNKLSSRTPKVGLHFHIYRSISFKLCMMIDLYH